MSENNLIGGVAKGLVAARDAVGGAAEAAAGAVAPVAGKVLEAGGAVAGAAVAAGAGAAQAVGGATADVYAAFGGSVEAEVEGNLKDEGGHYLLPEPVLSDGETRELDALTERYKKLNQPGLVARAGGKIASWLPAEAKAAVAELGEGVAEQKQFQAAMGVVARGVGALEKHAARASVSPEYVINHINQGKQEQKVSSIDEICLLRADDVARIANDERMHHLGLAFAEGAATGAPGVAGIPFNLALSMFLYFRAVQSVAMFYGYDVKGDADEMVIAGEVLTAAFGAEDGGPSGGSAAAIISKVMLVSETEMVKLTVGKGWAAMAAHGGIPLAIVQLRALAHAAAKKALANAGKKELEESVFTGVFTQIGRRLTQKAVGKAVPVVGGAIGALFDTGFMDKVLEFADVFYHKRFILEKEARIEALVEGSSFDEVIGEVAAEEVEVDDPSEATTDEKDGVTVLEEAGKEE